MKVKFFLGLFALPLLVFSISSISCKEDNNHPNIEETTEDPPTQEDKELPAEYTKHQVKGGYHVPMRLGTTKSNYGYYIFIPESYVKEQRPAPLLVFLHGSGERGNSQNNPQALDLAIVHGPGKLVREGNWDATNNMLVVSVQTDRWWNDNESLKKFIDHIKENYNVDNKRVYLTGVSMGAYGIFDYLGAYGDDSGIAAAVPICGRGNLNDRYVRNLASTPIWVFHGEWDDAVPVARAHEIVSAINSLNPPPPVKAKKTLYPNVGHDSWTMTYDGSGQSKENPNHDKFDMDVFKWMLQYSKQ